MELAGSCGFLTLLIALTLRCSDGTLVNQLVNPRLRLVQPQVGSAGQAEQQAPTSQSSLTIRQARAKLDEATYECQLIKRPARAGELERPNGQKGAGEGGAEEQLEGGQEEGAAGDTLGVLKVHGFQLKLLVAPRLAPFEFPQDAQVGQRALLTCSALEGQRPISFVWLKDNQIIGSQEPGAQADSAAASGKAAAAAATTTTTTTTTNAETSGRLAGATLGQVHRRQLSDKFALSQGDNGSGAGQPAYVLVERAESESELGQAAAAEEEEELEVDAELVQQPDEALQASGELQVAYEQDRRRTRVRLLSKARQQQQQRKKPIGAKRKQVAQLLSDPQIRLRQADDYSILAIDSLELRHAGRYTCSAQNEAARVAHSAQLAINGECGRPRRAQLDGLGAGWGNNCAKSWPGSGGAEHDDTTNQTHSKNQTQRRQRSPWSPKTATW